MEENDILGQYNLPDEVEKFYCQVDALAVYNIQHKIDILYAQNQEGTELDYTGRTKLEIIRDALADYSVPGLKNIINGDGFHLFLSNFLGGAYLRCLPSGISQLMLTPRPGIGTEAYATNLTEVIIASMSQCESVVLGGELIELIKKDEDMQKKENVFINDMIKNENYIQTGKYSNKFGVQFGGSRGCGDGSWGPEAFDAAANPLTWIIRNTTVHAEAEENMDGIVTIKYTLDPNEKLDLRPNGTEWLYDAITTITGFAYHDILRGNDQMRVKATWSTIINLCALGIHY